MPQTVVWNSRGKQEYLLKDDTAVHYGSIKGAGVPAE